VSGVLASEVPAPPFQSRGEAVGLAAGLVAAVLLWTVPIVAIVLDDGPFATGWQAALTILWCIELLLASTAIACATHAVKSESERLLGIAWLLLLPQMAVFAASGIVFFSALSGLN
jgi:hypothetical protein